MVDVNEIYKSNSDYIKAEDIGNNMWTMTIKTADVKRFDDGSCKIILTFHGWEKCLPLNVTNARAISEMHGHNSDAWIGRQIMLMSMPVDYQGKTVLGIRVRAPVPVAAPGGPTPAPSQPSYQAQQHSPQRPLDPPRQTYQQVANGDPQAYNPPAPPPTDNDTPF
jgi:hypothetical protein